MCIRMFDVHITYLCEFYIIKFLFEDLRIVKFFYLHVFLRKIYSLIVLGNQNIPLSVGTKVITASILLVSDSFSLLVSAGARKVAN